MDNPRPAAVPSVPLLQRIGERQPVQDEALTATLTKGRIRNRTRKGKERATEDSLDDEDDKRIYTPWCDELNIPVDCEKEIALHHELVAFTKYILPTNQETTARKQVINCINTLIKHRWSKVRVDVFGSVATNLLLPDGDIDIVVTFPYNIDDRQKKNILFQIAALLKRMEITDYTNVVAHARVPIVTFKTSEKYGSYNVDISLTSGTNVHDGVKAASIVNVHLNSMPVLSALILAVKALLSQRQLNSAANGSLSSYGVICMCVNFLQRNPTNRDSLFFLKPEESTSLGHLLLDFLNYYGQDFPYETSVISVQEGKLLDKVEKGWVITQRPAALSVQCLVDSEKDVTKGCGKIDKVKKSFMEVYESISNAKMTFPYTSLLGYAFKLSKNVVISYREHLCDLVDSGTLSADIKQRECADDFSSYYPKQRPPIRHTLPPKPETGITRQNDRNRRRSPRLEENPNRFVKRNENYNHQRHRSRPYDR